MPTVDNARASSGGSGDKMPLVSVVLPTRSRPELARESISSVVGQDYGGPIECIVIHDQEPLDPTLESLGRDSHTVSVAANRHSAGLAGARNSGLDLASGDFIASCDDDDVWHRNKLSTQVARLAAEPDLLVVGSGLRFLLSDGTTQDWPGRSNRIGHELLLRNRVKELHSSTLVMRRDAFAKAGRYDEELPNSYAEDYDWVLRAARVGRIGIVREPLADIRKGPHSWYQGRAENNVVALRYFLDKHPEIRSSRRGHARILGQIAYAMSVTGDRKGAWRYIGQSFVRWPPSPYTFVAVAHAIMGVDPARVAAIARRFGRGIA